VPKAVRDVLGVRPGDDIEFVPRGADLVVEVRHRRDVLDFAGIGADGAAGVPGSAAELDDAIEHGMGAAARERSARVRSEVRRST